MPGFSLQNGNPSNSINHKAEFHRSHRWRIENLGIPPGTAAASTVSRLQLYAQSIQLPSLTFDEEVISSGSAIEYKIAKKAKWQDFTIKFYDVYGIYDLFQEWQKLIWNQKDGIGRADKYKGTVVLLLTDYEGDTLQTYSAHGAYPKSITHGELSYAVSDVKLLTVTYSYDYATMLLEDDIF